MNIFIDTETTGLGHVDNPPRDDAVVEVGVAYRFHGDVVRWSTFMNPGAAPFADGRADIAMGINKISMEDVLGAPSPHFAYGMLARELEWARDACSAPGEPLVLVAYNVGFDRPFVEKNWPFKAWLEKNGVTWLCAMERAKMALGASGHLSLKKACAALGVHLDSAAAHRASYDAVLAMRVWEALDDLIPF
jgi:DNA polymerase III epsilon subunit-like protein